VYRTVNNDQHVTLWSGVVYWEVGIVQ